MNFASDNWAGTHPAIAQHLLAAGSGFAAPYGNSELDRNIERRFCELFEREVAVFFVGTGTAANALALAAINRPGGVTFATAKRTCWKTNAARRSFSPTAPGWRRSTATWARSTRPNWPPKSAAFRP
ncbi:beta-eliminating lyase-related protein, partial [Methylomonas koyamae]|uniref:beta-eliminating lyase-related protein n=1 Tax=Methylomonas koyamae TaxID=702114 RepID=UPI0027E4C2E1